MARYRTIYAHLITGDILGELPATSFSCEWVLNSPGSYEATLPLRLAEPYNKLTGQVLTPELSLEEHAVGLYVERDGQIIWAGPLEGIEVDVESDTLTIHGAGYQELFRRRLIREDLSYSATEQLLIAKDLIDVAQSKPGGDLRIDTSALAATASGVLRDRTYRGFERATVAERLEELAAVNDGFDFRFGARWEGGAIAPYMEASYPPTGRVTDHVFALGVNVALLSYTSDLTTMVNWCDAMGSGDGQDKLTTTYVDASRLATWGLREAVESRMSVVDSSTLLGHARRRVIEGRYPNRQIHLQVYPDAVPVFGSYLDGDVVRVRGSHGYLQVDDFYRLTTRTLSVEDDGTESVDITATSWRLYTDG